jgi:hypothetical protein
MRRPSQQAYAYAVVAAWNQPAANPSYISLGASVRYSSYIIDLLPVNK